MTLTNPPESQICAECRRPITVITDAETGTVVELFHAGDIRGGLRDHEPVPVVRDGSHVIAICDFCNSADPTWNFPAMDFTARRDVYDPRNHRLIRPRSMGSWLACELCADDILHDRWTAILDRYLRNSHLNREQKRQQKKELAGYHQQFRASRSGPPTPYIDG